MTENEDGTFKAVVKTVTKKEGKTFTDYENFTGTEAQVKASVKGLKETDISVVSKKVKKDIEEEVIVK